MQFYALIIIVLATNCYSHPQGLNPGCPSCECEGASRLSPSSGKIIDFIGNLPDNLKTPHEALSFIKTKISDQNVYKYVATETLKQFDKVIDDSVEVSNKFSVLAELVAGHLLDAVIPGGSAIFEGIKFMLSLFKDTKKNKIAFSKMLDPAQQEELVNSIAEMLKRYESEEPGCLRDSNLRGTDHKGVTVNNFIFHNGVCPPRFDVPLNESVHLVDIRIKVPVDFSRADHKQLLIRGPYSISFDDQYSIVYDGKFMKDREALERLLFLYYHATLAKEISVHNVVANMNIDDLSMLSGDDYSQCLQRSLFYQKGIYEVTTYYGSYIPYEPTSFSRSQIGVKRLTCYPAPPSNGCAELKCSASKAYFELIASLDKEQPTDFNTNYPGRINGR